MVEVTLEEIYAEVLPLLLDAVIIFGAAYLLARVISFLLIRISEYSGQLRFIIRMIVPIINIIIYTAAIMLVVDRMLTLSTIEIVALSGLLGAAMIVSVFSCKIH